MPPWKPIKRRESISGPRRLGFVGPYSGGKHEFMQKGDDELRTTMDRASTGPYNATHERGAPTNRPGPSCSSPVVSRSNVPARR